MKASQGRTRQVKVSDWREKASQGKRKARESNSRQVTRKVSEIETSESKSG